MYIPDLYNSRSHWSNKNSKNILFQEIPEDVPEYNYNNK